MRALPELTGRSRPALESLGLGGGTTRHSTPAPVLPSCRPSSRQAWRACPAGGAAGLRATVQTHSLSHSLSHSGPHQHETPSGSVSRPPSPSQSPLSTGTAEWGCDYSSWTSLVPGLQPPPAPHGPRLPWRHDCPLAARSLRRGRHHRGTGRCEGLQLCGQTQASAQAGGRLRRPGHLRDPTEGSGAGGERLETACSHLGRPCQGIRVRYGNADQTPRAGVPVLQADV